jgi:hypothetical protein
VSHTKTLEFTMSMPGKGSADASAIERRTYRITWQ